MAAWLDDDERLGQLGFTAGFQQLFVSSSGEAEFRCSDDVVPQVNQMAGCGDVDVLIEEKPHQAGAARRRMSSAPTKAMA